MSKLSQVVESVEKYNQFVLDQVRRARTAHTEIEQRLEQNRQTQQLVDTVAKRHRDPGVDRLFELISKESVAAVYDRRTKQKRRS